MTRVCTLRSASSSLTGCCCLARRRLLEAEHSMAQESTLGALCARAEQARTWLSIRCWKVIGGAASLLVTYCQVAELGFVTRVLRALWLALSARAPPCARRLG